MDTLDGGPLPLISNDRQGQGTLLRSHSFPLQLINSFLSCDKCFVALILVLGVLEVEATALVDCDVDAFVASNRRHIRPPLYARNSYVSSKKFDLCHITTGCGHAAKSAHILGLQSCEQGVRVVAHSTSVNPTAVRSAQGAAVSNPVALLGDSRIVTR